MSAQISICVSGTSYVRFLFGYNDMQLLFYLMYCTNWQNYKVLYTRRHFYSLLKQFYDWNKYLCFWLKGFLYRGADKSLARPTSRCILFNLLAPEFGILILAHPVCKMWITQEPKKVALWNKRQFVEKKRRVCSMFKKIQYVYLLKKYIKWGV